MFEEILEKLLPIPINILEVMGIIVIVVGAVKSFYHYLLILFKKEKYPIKSEFANTMAMGLEFKLAAEILKTVLIRSIHEILILGSITLLRGFMTFIINWELKSEREEKKEKFEDEQMKRNLKEEENE